MRSFQSRVTWWEGIISLELWISKRFSTTRPRSETHKNLMVTPSTLKVTKHLSSKNLWSTSSCNLLPSENKPHSSNNLLSFKKTNQLQSRSKFLNSIKIQKPKKSSVFLHQQNPWTEVLRTTKQSRRSTLEWRDGRLSVVSLNYSTVNSSAKNQEKIQKYWISSWWTELEWRFQAHFSVNQLRNSETNWLKIEFIRFLKVKFGNNLITTLKTRRCHLISLYLPTYPNSRRYPIPAALPKIRIQQLLWVIVSRREF